MISRGMMLDSIMWFTKKNKIEKERMGRLFIRAAANPTSNKMVKRLGMVVQGVKREGDNTISWAMERRSGAGKKI